MEQWLTETASAIAGTNKVLGICLVPVVVRFEVRQIAVDTAKLNNSRFETVMPVK